MDDLELMKLAADGKPYDALIEAIRTGDTLMECRLRNGLAHMKSQYEYAEYYGKRPGQAGWQIDTDAAADTRQDAIVDLVCSYRPTSVLDAGGADGTVLAMIGMLRPETELILVDPWREGCSWFQKWATSHGIPAASAIPRLFEDCPPVSPDVIIMAEVLEHVLDPAAYCKKATDMSPRAIVVTVPQRNLHPKADELERTVGGGAIEHVRQVTVYDLVTWLEPYHIVYDRMIEGRGWENLIVSAERKD